MKKPNYVVAIAFICLVVGFALRSLMPEHSAYAAENRPMDKKMGRFQISSSGSSGCYMVDTATGDLWYSQNAQEFKKASGGPSFVH